MPSKIEALGILLLLLPGFICAFFVQLVAIRPKQTEFEKVVEALLFSAVLYLFIGPFFGISLPVHWTAENGHGAEGFSFIFNAKYLFCLVGVGSLMSLAYGAGLNRDIFHATLRRLKLTEKTSRVSVWNDALQDIQSRYLLVELGDQRTVVGYLRYYSDDVEQASLFLEDAAWLNEDGLQTPIEGPGILLTKDAGIVSISFLDPVVTDPA